MIRNVKTVRDPEMSSSMHLQTTIILTNASHSNQPTLHFGMKSSDLVHQNERAKQYNFENRSCARIHSTLVRARCFKAHNITRNE